MNARWRSTIADYAVPLAVVICVGISYAVKDHVSVERLSMPRNFEPTYSSEDGDKRAWFQGFGNGGMTAVLVSMVAAVPIVSLFYIDHLFSCILGQNQSLVFEKENTTTPPCSLLESAT